MSKPKILFDGETEHLCYTAYTNWKVTITKWTGHAASVVIPETIRDMDVTAIASGVFCGKQEVQKIVLPRTLKKIGYEAFFGCTKLCEVNIPPRVCSIGSNAFAGTPWLDAQQGPFVIVGDGFLLRCTDPQSHIVIPDGVKTIGHAFFDCPEVEEITLPDSVTKLAREAFSLCTKLERFTAGNNLRTIDAEAFSRCIRLQQVDLPNTLSYVGDGAFRYCRSLREVTLSGSPLRLGTGLFGFCTKLRSAQICGKVRHLPANTFSYCEALETCTLPDTVLTIGECAFEGCKHLRTLSLPESLQRIEEYAFSRCDALQELAIPGGVEHIGSFALWHTPWLEKQTAPFVVVGHGVLIVCNEDVEELHIPQGVRAVDCCYQWDNLRTVVIPEGVVEIGDAAFGDCQRLKKVVFPRSLREVGEHAFRYLENYPELPIWVRKIGSEAFCTYEAEMPLLPTILEEYSGDSYGLRFLCGKFRHDIYADLQVRLNDSAQMFTLARWLDSCARIKLWKIPSVLVTKRLFLDGEAFDWSDEDDGMLLRELLHFRERNKLFTVLLVDYKNENFRRWETGYAEKYGSVTRYIADGRGNTK